MSAAIKSFVASTAINGSPTATQRKQAQDALGNAAAKFVASGEAASSNLRSQFAQALSPDPQRPAKVLTADFDGNGKPDVLVAVPMAGLEPIVVPNAQSTWLILTPDSAVPLDGTVSAVQVHDFAGQGQSDIVMARTTQGASSLNTRILVLSWGGQKTTTLFDQTVTDWAGPATWEITADGSIKLTCPAFGIYDHKLLAHLQQTRLYHWNGSEFALAMRHTDPPTTKRQLMNLAEADFFDGDFPHAIAHYQTLSNTTSLADEPGDKVDWPNFARFRLGEIAALTGDQASADKWLAAAAKAAPPLGALASDFLKAETNGGAAAGFAALQQSNLPTLFERAQMGNLDFPVSLGPFGALGEGVASYLDHVDNPTGNSPVQLSDALKKAGFQIKDLTIADLDGDETPEITMILPFGAREQTLWLFVHSEAGWHAIATVPAPRGLAGLQPISGHRQAIRVIAPSGSSPPETSLIWDGHQVTTATSPTSTSIPVATDFQSSDSNCFVAEDVGGG